MNGCPLLACSVSTVKNINQAKVDTGFEAVNSNLNERVLSVFISSLKGIGLL